MEFGISAGIVSRRIAKDLVPIDEEHAARLERGINLETWSRMDVDEKALLVASRRIRVQAANLQSEAQIRQSKREANKVKPRRGK